MADRPVTPRRAGGSIELVSQATTAHGRPRYAVQDPPGREYELAYVFSQTKVRAKTFDEMATKADRLHSTRFTAIDGDGTRTDVHRSGGHWPVPAPPRWMDFPGGPGMVRLAGAAPRSAAERAQAAESARLRTELHAQYRIQRTVGSGPDRQASETSYRSRDHAASFTESGKRIETDSGRHDVVRAMVDVAQIRGWTVQRVTGSEDFKRQVWLEASARDITTHGYDPKPWDLEMLRQARAERALRSTERPAPERPVADPSARQRAGPVSQRTVLAAVEAVLTERQMPVPEREAVLKATAERLAQRDARMQQPRPDGRTVTPPSPSVQATRPDAAPTR